MPNSQSHISIAKGFGSIRSGVNHWLQQRFTAVLLLILTPWIIYILFPIILNSNQFLSLDWLTIWYNKFALVSYFLLASWHGKLGLQIVIEDYIHNNIFRVSLLFLITVIWLGISVLSIIGTYTLN